LGIAETLLRVPLLVNGTILQHSRDVVNDDPGAMERKLPVDNPSPQPVVTTRECGGVVEHSTSARLAIERNRAG
jgi:hypothetical protein